MITLEFEEEPCHECKCCGLFSEALYEAGKTHSFRGKL